jgi:hypothetical protein
MTQDPDSRDPEQASPAATPPSYSVNLHLMLGRDQMPKVTADTRQLSGLAGWPVYLNLEADVHSPSGPITCFVCISTRDGQGPLRELLRRIAAELDRLPPTPSGGGVDQ